MALALTSKQEQVLDLKKKGMSTAAIARAMDIKSGAVASHVVALKKKGKLDDHGRPIEATDVETPETPVSTSPPSSNGAFARDDEVRAAIHEQRGLLSQTLDVIKQTIAEHEARRTEIESTIEGLQSEDQNHAESIEILNERFTSTERAHEALSDAANPAA